MNIDCQEVTQLAHAISVRYDKGTIDYVAGVPNGGIPVAYAVAQAMIKPVDVIAASPNMDWLPRALVVDDIYDTGRTLEPYLKQGYRCATLVERYLNRQWGGNFYAARVLNSSDWVTFPWEENNQHAGPEDAVVRLLQYLGRDPNEPGLQDTPRRVLEWFEMFRDGQELGSNLTTFDGETFDEMVVVRDVPFIALCEHHLIPFVGKAAVAYIPEHGNEVKVTTPSCAYCGVVQGYPHSAACTVLAPGEKGDLSPILGLSKLARIVQWRARRTTVQERLANEIRDEVAKAASTPNVAVSLEAEHFCMTLRGAKAAGSTTLTNALGGVFRTEPATRAEFLAAIRG